MATSSDLPPSYPPDAGSFYRTKSVLLGRLLPAFPYVAAFARRHAPLGVSKFYAAMRYDDVIEAFATDTALEAPYADNLAVVTGGRPFFLGMRDGPEYRAQLAAMRAVVLDSDMARLGDQAEAMASAIKAVLEDKQVAKKFVANAREALADSAIHATGRSIWRMVGGILEKWYLVALLALFALHTMGWGPAVALVKAVVGGKPA